jgi:hypothetical protein
MDGNGAVTLLLGLAAFGFMFLPPVEAGHP